MLHVCLVIAMAIAADPPPPAPTVTASSTRAGSNAAHLVDGKLDSVWFADADGAFGVGQWVRLDFGAEVEISRIAIHNGAHGVVDGQDGFCAHARAASVGVYGDGLRVAHVGSRDGSGRVLEGEVGQGMLAPLVTRTLTIVVEGVQQGFVHPATLAISEIEVVRKPAPEPAAESGKVTCGSRRMGLLRAAVIEHCAATFRETRPPAECDRVRAQFDFCKMEPPKWMPIAEKEFDSGKVSLDFRSRNPPFVQLQAAFDRETSGRWRVTGLGCKRGSRPCGLLHEVSSDGDRTDYEVRTTDLCKDAAGKYLRKP